MQTLHGNKKYSLPLVLRIPLTVVLVVSLFPLIALFLVGYLLYAIALQFVIWQRWCSHGRHILLVCSDSPHWHEYIATRIVPRLPDSTVVLNWSERRTWQRFSLPVLAFRLFGGPREFNPLIVVFTPFRWAKTFRFWQPFRDYKHGKTETLDRLEDELFHYLKRAGITTDG